LAVEAAISFSTAMTIQKSLPQAGVSAPHFLAAQTGRQILEAGGTALEAAVATAASLAVVYPHMNAVGGDSFWLIKKKDCAPVGVLACGQAAGRATVDLYKSRGFEAIPPRGALAAVTVPGTICGWHALLSLPEHPRRLTLKDILNPAVGFAANGFPVSASQERTTRAAFESLRSCPGFAEVFLNSEGLPWTKGQTLRQSALLARCSDSQKLD
jgi:gamma-glutamyltranspeptidase